MKHNFWDSIIWWFYYKKQTYLRKWYEMMVEKNKYKIFDNTEISQEPERTDV